MSKTNNSSLSVAARSAMAEVGRARQQTAIAEMRQQQAEMRALALLRRANPAASDIPGDETAHKGGLRREYAPPERIAKLIEAHQAGANITTRAGDKQYIITIDMTVGEAAAMLRWLEKRRARRG